MNARRASRRPRRTARPLLAWAAACLLLALLAVVLLPGPVLQRLLASERAREFAESAAASALALESARFDRFTRRGDLTHSAAFEGRGPAFALDASDLRAALRLEGWPGGTLRMDNLTIRKATLVIDPSTGSASDERRDAGPGTSARPSAWWLSLLLPAAFEMSPAMIESADAEIVGGFALRGFRATLAPEGRGLRIRVADAGIETARLPGSWRAAALDILHIDGEVRLISSQLVQAKSPGTVTVAGAWSPGKPSSFVVELQRVPLDAVAPGLANTLDGPLDATARIESDGGATAGDWSIVGDARLDNARLASHPALDTLARLAGDESLRSLKIESAGARFAHAHGVTRLSGIAIESRGTLRVEGALDIRDDRSLDGLLELGFPPEFLARLPSAAALVFTNRRDGHLWTPVRISGTLDAPRNDLASRLAAALPAGILLDSARSAAGTGTEAVGAAEAVVEEAGGAVHDAGRSLLDFLLPR